MAKKKRMAFIPEMKDWLTKGLMRSGVASNTIERAFELWEAGKEPTNIWERGCFNMFQAAQDDVDRHYGDTTPADEPEPREPDPTPEEHVQDEQDDRDELRGGREP